MSEANPGELLVGAYHRKVTEAELVSYNQRSERHGDQMEIDVLAIASNDGTQVVYVCEVLTHLDGNGYPGKPKTDKWDAYGNDSYQRTIEKFERKFRSGYGYVTRVFDDADQYRFQLWSPYLHKGKMTDGLEALSREFAADNGDPIELILNEDYTERIDELRSLASEETTQHSQPAYRYLQILEHLR